MPNLMRLQQTWSNSLLRVMAMLLGVLLVSAMSAQAALKVNITQGTPSPIPIALPIFETSSLTDHELSANLGKVIQADLEGCGLFKMIDPQAFAKRTEVLTAQPNFQAWKDIHAEALVVGRLSQRDDGKVQVEFRLWDVFSGEQLEALSLATTRENWRRLAHMVADAIYKRITGEEGYFDTRIVYVAETGPLRKRKKRLAIMDIDGFNHRFLTDGSNLVLMPRFSPVADDEIAYMAYIKNKPRVYLMKLNGQQQRLGEFQGMTFAPNFSADGQKVVMSLEMRGRTCLYTMDLATRKVTQLTKPFAIDTSPSFSPDQKQVAFVSDRGGRVQLYVMDLQDPDHPRRISFSEGSYMAATWSPRGDLIAFVRKYKDEFYLGVMAPDGSNERYLTKGFFIDSPSWAPNGAVLTFMRTTPTTRDGKGGSSRIFTIDVTGRHERALITPQDASDPAWSPLGH